MKNYNKLFVSIASNPGIFGSTIYNKFFSDYKLAYFYKALKVEKSTLKKIIKNLNTFNISGCSVSMPFKSDVITFLDVVDKNAKEIGSVNTILNISGKLIGYNTDFFGIQKCISKIKLNKKDKVLIIGAG